MEGDLVNNLRLQVDHTTLPVVLDFEEPSRLPFQQLVGEALESLAQHDEPTPHVPGTQMQVGEPSLPAPRSPFSGEYHEIEGVGGLHLQPSGATTTGLIRLIRDRYMIHHTQHVPDLRFSNPVHSGF